MSARVKMTVCAGLMLLAARRAACQINAGKTEPNPGPGCVLPLGSDFLQQHRARSPARGGYEAVSGKILRVSQAHFTTPYDFDVAVCLRPDDASRPVLKNCMGISNPAGSLTACDPDKKERALDLEIDLCRYVKTACAEDPDLARFQEMLNHWWKGNAPIQALGLLVDDLKHDGGRTELHPVEVLAAKFAEAGRLRYQLLAGKNNRGLHRDKTGYYPAPAYDDRKTHRLVLQFPPQEAGRREPVCELHEFVNRRSGPADCFDLSPVAFSFSYQPAARTLTVALTPHLARSNGRLCADDPEAAPAAPHELSNRSTGLFIGEVVTRWQAAPGRRAASGESAASRPLRCTLHRSSPRPLSSPEKSAPK
jgi:hypothetical protein